MTKILDAIDVAAKYFVYKLYDATRRDRIQRVPLKGIRQIPGNVDNGKSLPIWKELPPNSYWLLPAAVGLPLVIYTLLRHPLVRRRG